MSDKRPNVVVLGGGFAGINTVLSLKNAPVDVTLIDRENHHLFQPLLYQVATAVLNPADIAYPLRKIFRRQANARVLLAEAKSVNLDTSMVVLDNGAIQFDYLVIATGARHAYFGNPEWEEVAPGLKSVEDALELRRRILLAYEAAERESDPEKRREWLRFAVVGAGPTGAEMAGAMAEIGRQAASDHARVHPEDVEVVLVEGQAKVLPGYAESLSDAAERQLQDLGVAVRTESMVESMDADGLTLSGGEQVAPFRYKDKGWLATLCRAAAVADFGRIRFSGFFAWLAWLVIHVLFLVGFRNRVWVLSGWARSYLEFQRGARLITGRNRHRTLPKVG